MDYNPSNSKGTDMDGNHSSDRIFFSIWDIDYPINNNLVISGPKNQACHKLWIVLAGMRYETGNGPINPKRGMRHENPLF